MVYLDSPAPPKVTVSLTCKNGNTGTNYSEPYTVTTDLTNHKSPSSKGSYIFPFDVSDLRENEYYVTRAVHSSNGGMYGNQIFALDIHAEGYDPEKGTWNKFRPDKSDHSQKESHRMWDKNVRSMAKGTVDNWDDTNEDNATKPGNLIWIKYETPGTPGTPGTHLTTKNIEFVRYSHLQKNSIPDEIKLAGIRVHQGQIIGKVGNSGGSNNSPHTHVQCQNNIDFDKGLLRPLPFHDAWVVDFNK